jgi:Ca2+-binding RTX toxin-like protein
MASGAIEDRRIRAPRGRPHIRPGEFDMIEHLEIRRLFAVTATFANGVLTVTGDDAANRVSISRNLDSGQLLVRSGDALVRSVAYAEVNSITVNLLGGEDRLNTASNVAKPMTVNGGEGSDNLLTGGGADVVHGNGGNDTINTAGGADTLFGDEGNDTMDGGGGGDSFNGNAGSDTVTYAARAAGVRVTLDNLANDGTPANNELPEGERDNVRTDIERVIGGRGNDFMSAAPVSTTAGTIAPSRITFDGMAGNDTLTGASGATAEPTATAALSILNGGDGNDVLNGGSRADALNGGNGNDTMAGNGGNDSLVGGNGADSMSGGEGTDTDSYADRLAGVVVTLDNVANDGTPPNNERPEGERDNVRSDVERVIGGRGNDRIIGNGAANVFSGGEGNDTLEGGGGNDVMEGGNGDDTLRGGEGNDILVGGLGRDSLFGDGGNDFLRARDRLADILDGGAGSEDRAERDAELDQVTNVEIIVT